MTDASGRSIHAPLDIVPLLLNVNAAAARLVTTTQSAKKGMAYDGGVSMALQVGFAIEPSMMTVRGSFGGCKLQISASDPSLPDTSSAAKGDPDGSGRMGPGTIATGCEQKGSGNSLSINIVKMAVGERQAIISKDALPVSSEAGCEAGMEP